MMSANSTMGDCLIVEFEIGEEFGAGEWVIIGMETFQLNTMSFSESFETTLTGYRLANSE